MKETKGFTLIELLVVISIIGLLAGAILINVSSSRESARMASIIQTDSSIKHVFGAYCLGQLNFDGNINDDCQNGAQITSGGSFSYDNSTPFSSGQSLNLNGGYVTLNNLQIDSSNGGKNTVVFWMKWNGGNTQMPFSFNSSYDLFIYANCIGFNTFNSDVLGFSSAGMANKWVHVAAVFYNAYAGNPVSSTNNSLYIDGVKRSIVQCNSSPILRSVSSVARVGGYTSGGYNFLGNIDDFRIYKGDLSAAEIKKIYAQGLYKAGLKELTKK